MNTNLLQYRHVVVTPDEQQRMLKELGFNTITELIDNTIPTEVPRNESCLPEPIDELTNLGNMRFLAEMNNPLKAMIGLGFYGTITPGVIRRNILENPAWYTAYTPYQPEISQGRLEALLNFQTMVQDLTGLPLAGASLLDEATAAAEAMRVALRKSPKKKVFLVSNNIFPQTLEVLHTHAKSLEIEIIATDSILESMTKYDVFGVLIQTPGNDGRLYSTSELSAIADEAHRCGAMVIALCDLLSLTLVVPPGEWGADIAVGTTQRFGVPLFYGGPHAGFMALSAGLERVMPGRLVGVSKDADGDKAYRLALQTREQHIRREKATSNICTAQVLLAVVASMYAVYHGPSGLTKIASAIHDKARVLAGLLVNGGLKITSETFFDTIVVEDVNSDDICRKARQAGIHLRNIDERKVGISIGEDCDNEDLNSLAKIFGVSTAAEPYGSVGSQKRSSLFLTHKVFASYHSELEITRYIRRLSDRDYALDRGMIPLGSCTMKLTATSEIEPISYPGFANLHPFVPIEDAKGYQKIISDLESWLCELTGYDRVTIRPNAGSQGEFAGLMAIRAYHEANGDFDRKICLIPASAHGTNAASAAMAGFKVVVVKTTADGEIDADDLAEKIKKHRDELAAIMVTYPSTHGVFGDGIVKLCDSVHEAGGQVYIDGANMNALVGIAKFRNIGADVSHLNLHKTFAIPHGGGGPGVGPVGVRSHLVPFLDIALTSSPQGSAGVLPISYGYISMMGSQGLQQATKVALLNANYIAQRLKNYYPVLYTGSNGYVAHECILDLRDITKTSGVSVEDVAKRLIDYGFHAPTLSFPVNGTLLVEPTESESLNELNRFCDAMISIRHEIDQVGSGYWDKNDNPLVNAPHPVKRLLIGQWTHPYSRAVAAFGVEQPDSVQVQNKFWPSVARLDNTYGDRNLCTSQISEE